jgi:hypothetical protein
VSVCARVRVRVRVRVHGKLNINAPATERVEQMDLGEGLLNMGGLVPSIQCLASNHSIIRQRAAAVVAAAVQNDDKLKEAAPNSSALQKLLSVYANRDESHETRSKSLHAISALIKGNSTAELHFLFNQVKSAAAATPSHPIYTQQHRWVLKRPHSVDIWGLLRTPLQTREAATICTHGKYVEVE